MKIVINRTDAIGDTVLTMPMARAIKENFPDCHLVFLVSAKSRDLFRNNPDVDECWVLHQNHSWMKKLIFLTRKFKEFKPDTYFFVGGSHLPSMVAKMFGVKFRGGLRSKWPSFLWLNKGVRQSRSLVTMHESDYNFGLLKPLGIDYSVEDRVKYKPQINLTEEEKVKAKEALDELMKEEGMESGKPLVVIHPGMVGHTLNWSSRNYARLIYRIDKEHIGKFNFLISHTPSDERFLTGLRDQLARPEYKELSNRVLFYDGSKRGLRNFICLLKDAHVFIGPSTGPTHLANILGVRQIGIYSPIKVQSAMRWGPFDRNENTTIIVPDVVCGEQFECAGDLCPYYECMAKVEVEDVYNSFKELTI